MCMGVVEVCVKPEEMGADALPHATLLVDLTAHTRCRMLAVHAHEVPALLRTPSDLAHPSVVAALTAQVGGWEICFAMHAPCMYICTKLWGWGRLP